MSYQKFPIVWWKDNQETFYARTVSGEFVCAADSDLKKCLKQIKAAMLCLLYTSPSPRDRQKSRMPSSA